jgi:hypothetical protein
MGSLYEPSLQQRRGTELCPRVLLLSDGQRVSTYGTALLLLLLQPCRSLSSIQRNKEAQNSVHVSCCFGWSESVYLWDCAFSAFIAALSLAELYTKQRRSTELCPRVCCFRWSAREITSPNNNISEPTTFQNRSCRRSVAKKERRNSKPCIAGRDLESISIDAEKFKRYKGRSTSNRIPSIKKG